MSKLEVPYYLMPRPAIPRDPEVAAELDAIYLAAREKGGGHEIQYESSIPKWQFLARLADRHGLLMHGSGDPSITMFEPRQSNDVTPFGDQCAVYAASDGLWPMYFAILDRSVCTGLINSCIRFELSSGRLSKRYYFFSVNKRAFDKQPFKAGWVYLLPRDGFLEEAPIVLGGRKVHLHHWASLAPVAPIAKLRITPEDFPFLSGIRGHDPKTIVARYEENPDGFPWLD